MGAGPLPAHEEEAFMSEPLKRSRITGPQSDQDMSAAFNEGVGKANPAGRAVTETGDAPDGDTPPSLVARNDSGLGNV